MMAEKYPAGNKALMLKLYSSGSADLKQPNGVSGRETGSIIMVKGRLRAYLQLSLTTAGPTPLLLNRSSRWWKMMERAWEAVSWCSAVLGSFSSCSLYCLVLKSSLLPTLIPEHSRTVCPPRLRTVVSWGRNRCYNITGDNFKCLDFHIKEVRFICGIFLFQVSLSGFSLSH